MSKPANSIKTFLVSEDGPSSVEYSVILFLIIVVCLVAVMAVGKNTNKKLYKLSKSLG